MIISLFFHRLDQLIPIQLCHFLNQGQVHMGVTMLGASLPGSNVGSDCKISGTESKLDGFQDITGSVVENGSFCYIRGSAITAEYSIER